MRTAIILAVLAVIALTGCTTSETVYLRNAAGQIAQCGPYSEYGMAEGAQLLSQERLQGCVEDYQRQGYERVPAP